jgi:ABC-type multidrug transport system permease subunit
MALAVIEAADGNDTGAGWAAAGAAAVVPLLLGVVGFLTRAATPWRTSMLVSGGVVAVFLAGSFLAQDVATGYVLAIGVGATFAMRLVPEVHDRRWRLWTTAGLAVYVKFVYVLSPSIAVVAAPLLPIIGISIVDSIKERRVRA